MTDRQTNRQTDIHTPIWLINRKSLARGSILWKAHIQETNNLLTNPDSSTNTKKNSACKAKFAENNFFCGNFTTFTSKSFQIWDHYFYHFCPRILIVWKFRHSTLGSGGKKTFKQSEQMKKKDSFASAIFHPLWEKVFKSETTSPLFFLGIPKIQKKIGHWTLGSGDKRPLNGMRKCDRQTDKQTLMRTFWLIGRINPEGQFFENIYV